MGSNISKLMQGFAAIGKDMDDQMDLEKMGECNEVLKCIVLLTPEFKGNFSVF